ncbi:hypothetical protein PROPEN_04003 [Proteus penneri ATCC 35198]|nr:hypothetical protein PROPEN_04003 [Proteus penneri ATCC 35198]
MKNKVLCTPFLAFFIFMSLIIIIEKSQLKTMKLNIYKFI